ncbi:iron-containing alcohol dehydrogenase [Pseudarthrobacter oxydans]|uniref:iron-containing alcohol dehydrogenase n=1 Tax=Pseudarthrobacter oxydans TaxID=1671 RepID=UPI0038098A13
MSSPRAFTVSTRVVSGIGALDQLQNELNRLNATRVALVADRGIHDVGLLQNIVAAIDAESIVAECLVDADPGLQVIEDIAEIAIAQRCDVVLAVGGGSALAVGKALAIRVTNSGPIERYEGATAVPVAPIPTIAVPTTAGSGSEVSKVLILHQEGRDVDVALRVEGSEPRTAILDGTVLRSLPRNAMLFAGLDALSHSMESLWAKRASLFTRSLAVSAGQQILDLLPLALDGVASGANASGNNDAVLQDLLDASAAANMACGNSGMGLVHALAAAPSIRIPHGLRNGIVLPYVADFNSTVMSADAKRLAGQLEGFYQRIAFTPLFAADAVGEEGMDAMLTATHGHPFRSNNLRESTDDDLRDILRLAGAGATSL